MPRGLAELGREATVTDWIERRLDELRREVATGEQRLEQLDRECAEVRATLLRISGAIQVLEELHAETTPVGPPGLGEPAGNGLIDGHLAG